MTLKVPKYFLKTFKKITRDLPFKERLQRRILVWKNNMPSSQYQYAVKNIKSTSSGPVSGKGSLFGQSSMPNDGRGEPGSAGEQVW